MIVMATLSLRTRKHRHVVFLVLGLGNCLGCCAAGRIDNSRSLVRSLQWRRAGRSEVIDERELSAGRRTRKPNNLARQRWSRCWSLSWSWVGLLRPPASQPRLGQSVLPISHLTARRTGRLTSLPHQKALVGTGVQESGGPWSGKSG
ncbi:hypothetical protein B0J13DRAFT_551317, partial [Dactylonectria estremocensis]